MNYRLLCLCAGLIGIASAANVSGKWSIPGGQRRPNMVVTLNQVGSRVTGSVTPPRGVSTGSPGNTDILGGKVEGDTVSFYIWNGLDKPYKTHYKGTVSADEMVLTVTAEGAPPPPPGAPQQQASPGQVTAKRID